MDPSRGYELVNEMRLLHMTLRRDGDGDLLARLTHVGTESKAWSEHLWHARAPFALQALAGEMHALEQELDARGRRMALDQAREIRSGLAEFATEVGRSQSELRGSLLGLRDEIAVAARDHARVLESDDMAALQGLIRAADLLATRTEEDVDTGKAVLALQRRIEEVANRMVSRGVDLDLPWRLQAAAAGYGAALEDAGLTLGAEDAFSFAAEL